MLSPQTVYGNEWYQDELRALHPEWSDATIRVMASNRGPIVSDEKPHWPNHSGEPWIRGRTADDRTCWV